MAGTALRERGLNHDVEQVTDELFDGLEQQLNTSAACTLTGRSRATHYRRRRGPVLGPRPARRR
jgi:hypothetical protein